jgi:acyl-CoA synthetase (AMP-forming)/AMP-acid ligase II
MSPGSAFDPIAIRTFLAGQMEPFKVPEIIVEIARIPRSFNGKLLRKELK